MSLDVAIRSLQIVKNAAVMPYSGLLCFDSISFDCESNLFLVLGYK